MMKTVSETVLPFEETHETDSKIGNSWIPVTPMKVGQPSLRKCRKKENDNESIQAAINLTFDPTIAWTASEKCSGEKRRKNDSKMLNWRTKHRRLDTYPGKSTLKATNPCKKKYGNNDEQHHDVGACMRKPKINLTWKWRSQPRVDLDHESMRVWKLLEEYDSERTQREIERDIDKQRWWEEERKLFLNRAHSFVAKMHLVQGNRCFREWRGSVVDSIVGAFLTQNVADQLSSSAFMSLPVEFPRTETPKDSSPICSDRRKLKAPTKASSSRNKILGNNERKMYWESIRKFYSRGRHKPDFPSPVESVKWEAVRQADTKYLAKVLSCRGMNDKLAGRIQDFLSRICRDHGSIDLGWLRNVPAAQVKQFLLTIEGLGLKSVECIRLLCLKQLAFPVDRNVSRIVVRLGWIPLQPMPETFELHLLENYPAENDVQKYLWPRLCTFNHQLLYEVHYHLITLGKVFCTKNQPNCSSCPLRAECKHYASANKDPSISPLRSFTSEVGDARRSSEVDIEDFALELNNGIKAELLRQAASLPMPHLNYTSRSRMTFPVFELPNSHPVLKGLCRPESDGPNPYLLATWAPGFPSKAIAGPLGDNVNKNGSDTLQGTLLIPVYTAFCGNFPLNGTYFQVNEVLADDDTSQTPIPIHANQIENLTRRTLYCGTSVVTICRGLSAKELADCFLEGYICLRGFNHETRAPKPLPARFRNRGRKK